MEGRRPWDGVVQVSQDVEHGSDAEHVGVEVVGIHHGHGIAGRVVIGEVEVVALVVHDNVGHRWHSVLIKRSSVNCFACIVHQTSVDNGQVSVGHVLHHFLAFRVADVAESKEFCTAQIVLESHDVLVQLVFVGLEVSLIAISWISPFLAAPGNEPDGSLGFQAVSQEQSHGFEASDETSAIVVGSSLGSSVPRIDVSAHQQNFIRLLCPLNLEYQIVGVSIGNKLVLHY